MAATRARHCFELLDETSDPALLRAVEQSTLPDPVLDEGGMREREREKETTIFHRIDIVQEKCQNLLLDSGIIR